MKLTHIFQLVCIQYVNNSCRVNFNEVTGFYKESLYWELDNAMFLRVISLTDRSRAERKSMSLRYIITAGPDAINKVRVLQ